MADHSSLSKVFSGFGSDLLLKLNSLPDVFSSFLNVLQLSDTGALLIAFLVASFLVTLAVVRLAFLSKSKADAVAIVGLCGAGKTSLFYQLRDGTTHAGTVTSMEPNEGRFPLHSELAKNPKARPVHFIDLPGHPRLRMRMTKALPLARAIIFVIDASDFVSQRRPIAELLFDVLTNVSVHKRHVPIHVACNKKDKASAHSLSFIKSQLEGEINKLCTSRTAISSADVSSDVSLIRREGEPFTFNTCNNAVTFNDASMLKGSEVVADIEAFVRKYVKA